MLSSHSERYVYLFRSRPSGAPLEGPPNSAAHNALDHTYPAILDGNFALVVGLGKLAVVGTVAGDAVVAAAAAGGGVESADL